MKPDMHSKITLVILALLFGSSKALGKLTSGASSSEIMTIFTGSAIIGTLITLTVVWTVMRLFEKQQSAIFVTNGVLALGIAVSLIVTVARISWYRHRGWSKPSIIGCIITGKPQCSAHLTCPSLKVSILLEYDLLNISLKKGQQSWQKSQGAIL